MRLLARVAPLQGIVGALALAAGIYLRFGLWAVLVTLGAFMLVDHAMRGRS